MVLILFLRVLHLILVLSLMSPIHDDLLCPVCQERCDPLVSATPDSVVMEFPQEQAHVLTLQLIKESTVYIIIIRYVKCQLLKMHINKIK